MSRVADATATSSEARPVEPAPPACPGGRPAGGVGPSLGDRTAAGFAMMTAQMIVTRVTGLVGNLILAAILVPKDFGLFAMATTVMSLAGVVQQLGVREVLIHRQTSYRVWANAAFWITVAAGVGCGAVMAGAAPIAARFYGEEQLIPLLLVLAVSTPLANLTIVPETRLQMDLRFRLLARIALMSALGTTLLSIGFAAAGMGAYAFVLPRVIVSAARCVVMFKASGFRPRANLQLGRWQYLAGDSGWVFGACLCYTLITSGDSIVVGWRLGTDAAGIYFFAVSLSIQAVVLLVTNLGSVLLPAFGRLQGQPQRQADALVRSLGVLGMVVVPMCLLQAAAADPLLRLVYGNKWVDAILPLQLLSCGMSMRFLGAPATTLFVAQGRFRGFFLLAMGCLVFFAVLMWVALELIGGVIAVAAVVAIYTAITEPLALYLAIRPMGRGLKEVLRVCVAPAAVAGVGCVLGVLAARLVPEGPYVHVFRLVVIGAVACPVIALGSRLVLRSSWDEAVTRGRSMLAGKVPFVRARRVGDNPATDA